MSKEDRDELVRLQVASLRQGGHLMRTLNRMQKDAVEHSNTDTKLFAQQADRASKLEVEQAAIKTEISWMKKAGMFLLPMSIVARFIK